MPNRCLLLPALMLDLVENRSKDVTSIQLIRRQHRPILYVVEAPIRRKPAFLNEPAADDSAPALDKRREMWITQSESKVGPRGALHEAGMRCRSKESVPSRPCLRW